MCEELQLPYAAELSINRGNLSCSWQFLSFEGKALNQSELKDALGAFSDIVHYIDEAEYERDVHDDESVVWTIDINNKDIYEPFILNKKMLELSGTSEAVFPRVRRDQEAKTVVGMEYGYLDQCTLGLMIHDFDGTVDSLEWADITFIVQKCAEIMEIKCNQAGNLSPCHKGKGYMPEAQKLKDFRKIDPMDWKPDVRLEYTVNYDSEEVWWKFKHMNGNPMLATDITKIIDHIYTLETVIEYEIYWSHILKKSIPHEQDARSLFYATSEVVFTHEAYDEFHFTRRHTKYNEEISKEYPEAIETNVEFDQIVDLGFKGRIMFWRHMLPDGTQPKPKIVSKLNRDLGVALDTIMEHNHQTEDFRSCTQGHGKMLAQQEDIE